MLVTQGSLMISNYSGIYDIVVPEDHILRKIKELVDFSFIYEELKDKYSQDMGRGAKCPIRLFKYLLLKTLYSLSDRTVVAQSMYDMSFKYFLDMAPEESIIDHSLLTKFRKLRLQDVGLLDKLITQTVNIAIEKNIIKSKSVILDATHTSSRYNRKSPIEFLGEKAKLVRKAVYQIDETMKEKFPPKPETDDITENIAYCQKLIDVVQSEEELANYPKITNRVEYLEEVIEDFEDELRCSEDTDAKTGYKSEDHSFFGYKTHIAMNEERIITAAVISTGEASDGKYLKELVEKSKANGMEIKDVIADGAYSASENIVYANENEMNLVSKLNVIISGDVRRVRNVFEFNKDAGKFVCPAGHHSTKRKKKKSKEGNTVHEYHFNVNKCKVCPMREGCYKGTKTKTYSVTLRSDVHLKQREFQQSEHFKEKAKERYKIEAKNSELKNRHGYDVAQSSGLLGMQIQGAMTIGVANLKRIIKLMDEQ